MKKDLYKTVSVFLAAVVLSVCAGLFTACSHDDSIDYVAMVDTQNAYEELPLSAAEKAVYQNCRVEKRFDSNGAGRKIFYVVSEQGFIDEVRMVVLLEGSTVKKIAGVDVKESEEYGAKCFKDKYLTQFYGIDLSAIGEIIGKESSRDEGDVIYVTHATVTSKAVICGINAIAAYLRIGL